MSRAASTQRAAIAGLVVHLRSEGIRQVDIAARLGISQSSVSTYLTEAGRSGRLVLKDARARDERILRHRAEGLTQAETASRVGLSQSQVGVVLRRIDAENRRVIEESARARVSRARASHGDILDAWADGLGQYDLSLLTGRSEAAIRQIILRARRRRDPRAILKDSLTRSAAARAA